MNKLRKIAEQQKNQAAEKNKNKLLKQTYDGKFLENLSPITEKLDEVNESTEELSEIVENSDVEDGNTQ